MTEVRRVTDSIVCMRRPSYLTCSYLVRSPSGLVLVDAGMDSGGADVQAGLKAIGSGPEEIRAILLTHWHNDHAAGAAAIQRINQAPVYYHQGDLAQFTGEGGATGFRRWMSDRIPEVGVLVLAKGLLGESVPEPVTAQHYVTDGESVLEHFEVIATPGHTPGHVSYFYRPERALFTGDALAVIGGRIRFMARPVTMDHAAARQSMLKCLTREPRYVCPGHREPLVDDVERACARMQRHLEAGGPWPLLG